MGRWRTSPPWGPPLPYEQALRFWDQDLLWWAVEFVIITIFWVVLFGSLSLAEESFPLLSDPSFIPEFHQEIIQHASWENQGMCACVRFAWALALRSCSQWPNAVGAVEVLEEDEGVLDLAIDESVFGFLRYSVLGAANFHQEVHLQGLVYLFNISD